MENFDRQVKFIRQTLSRGNLKPALRELEAIFSKNEGESLSSYYRTFLLLKKQYEALQLEQANPEKSLQDLTIKENQLTDKVLVLLDLIEGQHQDQQELAQEVIETPRSDQSNRSIGAITWVNLLSGSLFLAGAIVVLLFVPCPTKEMGIAMRIVLSIGAAMLAATIPGLLVLNVNNIIQLGGAIVVFALIYMVDPGKGMSNNNCGMFSMSVFTHGPGGKDDIVLGKENQGKIKLEIDGVPLEGQISENGETTIRGIPGEFRNEKMRFRVQSDLYKLSNPDSLYLLVPGKSIYLRVIPYGLDIIKGFVTDWKGKVIVGADVFVGDHTDSTDSLGRFTIRIPPEDQKQSQLVTIVYDGLKTARLHATPQTDDPFHVILQPE